MQTASTRSCRWAVSCFAHTSCKYGGRAVSHNGVFAGVPTRFLVLNWRVKRTTQSTTGLIGEILAGCCARSLTTTLRVGDTATLGDGKPSIPTVRRRV